MRRRFLREEHIIPKLDALDREEALNKIVLSLPGWSLRGVERKKILELLLLREQFGTTAIGQGIALPHCFSPEVEEPIIAFAVSPDGVTYPSLDGRQVHFIFLLILPQTALGEQQKRQILQNIKWFLCDRGLQERLKSARTAAEIYSLMSQEPQRVSMVEV